MKNTFFLLWGLTLFFAGCGPEPKKNTVYVQPVQSADQLFAPPAPAATPANAGTGAQAGTGALNPAHGQPGHDCAIAVGAPLGSKAQPTGLSAPQPVTPTPAPAPAAVAAGTNPAHGQPGHDCAIAVGAPLKK